MTMNCKITTSIPDSHPSLPGHFPGHPVVPGVVILDEVCSALTDWRKNTEICSLPNVKFLAPLSPNNPFMILLEATGNNHYRFVCRNEEIIFTRGEIIIKPS